MNFYLFIYIVCSYAITIIFQAYSNIPIDYQIIGSALLLLCIGIPHGTLDHLITYKVQKTNKLKFYTYYLGTIVLFFSTLDDCTKPRFCFIFVDFRLSFWRNPTSFFLYQKHLHFTSHIFKLGSYHIVYPLILQ